MPQYTFTAVFLQGEDGRFIAYIEELPGAEAQGATMEEAESSLSAAVEMILAANRQFTQRSFASGHVLRRTALHIMRKAQ